MTAPHLSKFSVSRLPSASRSLLAFFLVCSALGSTAFAGSAASQTHSLMFSISDETMQPVQSVDVSGLVTYDSSTGTLSTVPVGTPLAGNWSWSNIDVTNSQILVQKVLTWHTDAQTSEGKWLSVIQLKASGNVDPFMSYSFSAKNNTVLNQNFYFSYGESIMPPISGNYSIYTDVAGSLTHGALSPVAQLTPSLGDLDGDGLSEIQTLKLSTNGGLTLFDAGVDVGSAQSRTATGTTVFGPITDTLSGNQGTAVNYWQFDVGFTLTPGKDAAALSGYAEITSLTAIPEPSTYAALMGGAALFGVMLRRRRSITA